jgi:hypothetical protein
LAKEAWHIKDTFNMCAYATIGNRFEVLKQCKFSNDKVELEAPEVGGRVSIKTEIQTYNFDKPRAHPSHALPHVNPMSPPVSTCNRSKKAAGYIQHEKVT